MAQVNVHPLPEALRKIPARWRPGHPPVFDGEPSPADIELARALFQALDPESQSWYGGRTGIFADL